MLKGIKELIQSKYPDISIIEHVEISPDNIEPGHETPDVKFYDVTFEYKGKKFSKLFHTFQKISLEEQFVEAMKSSKIRYVPGKNDNQPA